MCFGGKLRPLDFESPFFKGCVKACIFMLLIRWTVIFIVQDAIVTFLWIWKNIRCAIYREKRKTIYNIMLAERKPLNQIRMR